MSTLISSVCWLLVHVFFISLHRCKALRCIRRLAAQLTPPIVYAVLERQGVLVVNCILTINI